jgi:hypothetical protein
MLKLNPLPKIGSKMKRGIRAKRRLTILDKVIDKTNIDLGIYIFLNNGPFCNKQVEDTKVLWEKKFQSWYPERK